MFIGRLDAAKPDAHDERLDTLVGHQEVRAATERAKRHGAGARPVTGVDHGRFQLGLDEEAGGTTDTEGAIRRKGDALLHAGEAYTIPGVIDSIRGLDALASHCMTACGAGYMVWRLWGAGPPIFCRRERAPLWSG